MREPLNITQLATLRAALALYAEAGCPADPSKRSADIHRIATESGELEGKLSPSEVTTLDWILRDAMHLLRCHGRLGEPTEGSWALQHEFDHDETIVANTVNEAQTIRFAAAIPWEIRIAAARELATRLSGTGKAASISAESSVASYARMGWTPGDVQTLAPGLDDTAAAVWLSNNEQHIRARLVEQGWGVIEALLRADGIALDSEDEAESDWEVAMCQTAGIRLLGEEEATSDNITCRWSWASPIDESGDYVPAGFASKHAAAVHAIAHHFGREEWQQEAANGDTQLGYQEWVLHQAEAFTDEHNACATG
jgi:hypothetical protein